MDEQTEALERVVGQLLLVTAELVAAVKEQSEHNAGLVQAVAMLLGEETGTPLPDEGAAPERVDLDGNPY